MPSPSTTPRPPLAQPPRDFRLNVLMLRVAGILPWLLVLPIAVLVGLGLIQGGPLRCAAPILLAVMAALLPLSLWMRRMFNQMRAMQQEAAHRFTTSVPRPCRLENLKYADMNGQAFLVWDADPHPAASAGRPLFAGLLRFSRRVWTVPEKETVDLYLDSAHVSPVFGFTARTVSGWGERLTRERLDDGWRQTRRFMAGLGTLLVAGVLVLGWIMHQEYEALVQTRQWAIASQSWPTVTGGIVQSEVVETRISSGKSSIQGWKAEILYGYIVNGESYTGQRIHFGYVPTRSREAAQAIVARYPVGTMLDIHVDPAAPELSTLEPDHAESLDAPMTQLRVAALTAVVALLAGSLVPAGVVWYYSRRRRVVLQRLEAVGIL